MTNKYKQLIYLIISSAFGAWGCQTDSNRINKENYNFSILYEFSSADSLREDVYRDKYSIDTLYLFIEENFNNDVLEIYTNGKPNKQLSVKTDLSTGLADVVKIGNVVHINNLGIAINDSPVVSFELINKKMNLIGLEKRGKEIEICFYKKVPVFY
ncbi:hypothetical protein [Mangrovibacterium diazotrophicum]|uniref:Uncharacterized protein n=1 Tax=Mangrovibacterium diazotrophicum TaxID=1261403 RepID=A0A419VWB8_9BACT|nr:hypothetical protein [Mangrovibacterium diazotrophicum]RKD86401.1 hypothetical protein BC643_4092 [Mangrovibacterium diazotrophicum]